MAPAWESMPNRAWDTNVWGVDTRKIDRELGWRPRRTIHEGLTSTVHWLRGDPWTRRLYEQRRPDPGHGGRLDERGRGMRAIFALVNAARSVL